MRRSGTRGAVSAALLLAALALAGGALALRYEDAAGAAGVRFAHSGPDPRIERFPEITGGGACWADVDQDGFQDLFLVNNPYWNETKQAELRPTSRLFVSDGDGTFRDETAWSGLGFPDWGQGCAFGDYDGDALPDLFIAAWGMDALFRNDGDGSFTNVTVAAGVDDTGLCGDFSCWGAGAAWLDHDRDGDLDLYVANYVEWDGVGLPGPEYYNGQRNILWRNDGDGTFSEATDQAGVGDEPGPNHSKSFAAVVHDYDRDGWPDIYVASDTTPNTLFRNDRDGTFTDVAKEAGVDDSRASMGVAFQDADGDAWPDLYMTHYGGEHNGFYLNNRDGTFADHSGEGGLVGDWFDIGWGTGFHDLDLDGHVDVYAVNGHSSHLAPDHAQQRKFYRNLGGASFENATATAGPFFTGGPAVGRGSAVADYDWDGDLDIAVNNSNGTAMLGRASEAGGHWLAVVLRQPGMNRHAVGARVTVTLDSGALLSRAVQAGGSYLSQDALALHFGLGEAHPTGLEVAWPDGAVESFPPPARDAAYRLERGGAVESDVLAPRTRVLPEGEAGANGWWRAIAGVRLDAEDRGLPFARGVASTAYRLGDAPWQGHRGELVPLALGDGVHLLWVRSEDHAGNREGLWPRELLVDSTPPVSRLLPGFAASSNGWYPGPLPVRLEAQDATSGVQRIEVRLDGAAWEVYAGPLLLGEGVHHLAYRAVDVAGNVEAEREVRLAVDATPPEAWFVRPQPVGLALGALLVEVAVQDRQSGPAAVAFFVDDEDAPRWVDDTPEDGFTWLAQLPGGLHVLRARASDMVGLDAEARGPAVVAAAWPDLGAPAPAAAPLLVLLAGARRRR